MISLARAGTRRRLLAAALAVVVVLAAAWGGGLDLRAAGAQTRATPPTLTGLAHKASPCDIGFGFCISWDAPTEETGVTFNGYWYKIRKKGDTSWSSSKWMGGDGTTSFAVPVEEYFTRYEVQVRHRATGGSYGTSTLSEWTSTLEVGAGLYTFAPDDTAPTARFGTLRLGGMYPTRVLFGYDWPSGFGDTKAHCYNGNYEYADVSYKLKTDSEWTWAGFTSCASEQHYEYVTGLSSATAYEFRMFTFHRYLASNGAIQRIYGPASRTIAITTARADGSNSTPSPLLRWTRGTRNAPGPVLALPPMEVRVLPQAGGAEVRWQLSPDGDLATGYQYRYKTAETEWTEWADVPEGAAQGAQPFVLSGLTAGQEHFVQMRALSDAGAGIPSGKATATPTAADTPQETPDTDSGSDAGETAESGESAADPLEVSWSLPESHNGTEFTFDLSFSEAPPRLSYVTMRDVLVTADGGEVTRARRAVRGSNQRWHITVVPDGAGDVRLGFAAAAGCGEAGAVCTADGEALSDSLAAIVAGAAAPSQAPSENPAYQAINPPQADPPPAPSEADLVSDPDPGEGSEPAADPFKVSWSLPVSHSGERFAFELSFSEAPPKLSFRTVRDVLVTADGGEVTRARRAVRGSNQRWHITVVPDGAGDVRLGFAAAAACGDAGAVCTADGEALSNSLAATVAGP